MSRKYNYMQLGEDEMFRLGMLSHLEHEHVEDRYMDGDPIWWEEDEEYYLDLVGCLDKDVRYPIREPGWAKPSEDWWRIIMCDEENHE